MTQKGKKSNSLKRQRELSPGDNEKQSDGLKKRKSEKLEELFGDATFPDLKSDQTDRKKSSTCSFIQQNDDGVSSNSGIGFLDALNMVTSGNGKKTKTLNEKNQSQFTVGNEKQQTNLHESVESGSTVEENKNKLKKEQHKATIPSTVADKKEKVRKIAESQSEHKNKYQDLKEETNIAKNREHHKEKKSGKNKMAESKPQKHHKSNKEEDIKISEKQHNKKDQEIKGIEKYKIKKINKQKHSLEGKEETAIRNNFKCNLIAATVEEISSSSGIGFAEALTIASGNKSKTKKKGRDNQDNPKIQFF